MENDVSEISATVSQKFITTMELSIGKLSFFNKNENNNE